MQLVEVNQNTLIQWYNNRQKKQELSVLLQGIHLPQTLPEAQEPLQAAKRPRTEPEQPAEQHQYKLPKKHRRSGKAKADLYWTTPSQTQGTSTESYVIYAISTWSISADGTQHTYTSSTRFPGCADASGYARVPGSANGSKTGDGPGNANGSGYADASGNANGSGYVNYATRVTAYSCARHQFTACYTSCQSASHAQATLQENCRGKHLQEVQAV